MACASPHYLMLPTSLGGFDLGSEVEDQERAEEGGVRCHTLTWLELLVVPWQNYRNNQC